VKLNKKKILLLFDIEEKNLLGKKCGIEFDLTFFVVIFLIIDVFGDKINSSFGMDGIGCSLIGIGGRRFLIGLVIFFFFTSSLSSEIDSLSVSICSLFIETISADVYCFNRSSMTCWATLSLRNNCISFERRLASTCKWDETCFRERVLPVRILI
jgi:hypothetical protein